MPTATMLKIGVIFAKCVFFVNIVIIFVLWSRIDCGFKYILRMFNTVLISKVQVICELLISSLKLLSEISYFAL